MAEQSRAFDPREAREPHTGKWIAAGQGLANHLHGRQVVGRHITGRDVHGTYVGHGHVRTSNGVQVPVTHVQPVGRGRALAGELAQAVGAGSATELAAFPEKSVGREPLDKILAPIHGGPSRKVLELIAAGKAGPRPKGSLTQAQAKARLRQMARTAETATASTVHEPLGKPGGPGLFKHKGWQLPAYIQHVATDLREKGKDESRAIAMAIGIVRNWSEGHDGRGNKVSAAVQAAAAKAIGEWEALKAATHKTARRDQMADSTDADGLDASWDGDLSDLPDLTGLDVEDFEAAAAEGSGFGAWNEPDEPQLAATRLAKLGSGARFAALKAQLARKGVADPGALAAHIGRKKFGKAKFHALASKARKGKAASRAAPAVATRTGELFRYWPLEECRIMRADEGQEYSSGRVVEAYAAIYNTPAEIRDGEGHYEEEIDPGAFGDVLRAISPERNGGWWRATCLYNHGMTVHGTPAERFSLPAGVPREISSEGKGLMTRTEYAATPLGEELLELVNMGALRSQSFTGGIVRSDPQLRGPGDRYRKTYSGALQRVRRLVLGLREYGLTPFAAYSGAEVLGVRMQLPGGFPVEGEDGWEINPEDVEALATDGDGYGGPPEEGSASRSTGNRLYRLRTEELLAQRGITLP